MFAQSLVGSLMEGGMSCSVDLLIVEAMEIAAKMRLRRLVVLFDSWKLPLQQAHCF